MPTATQERILPELGANIQRLGEIRRGAEAVFDGLTENQLNWRPDPARWSAGECALHLLETNREYLDRIPATIRKAREKGMLSEGPFRYGWFSRWFVAQVEPPVRRRLPAPKKFGPPPRRATKQDVSEFLETLDRLVEVNRAASGVDLRVKIASPVSRFVRLNLGACLQLLGGHTLRHVLQAEKVTKDAGFPRQDANPGERA